VEKNGAATSFRVNFSGYVGPATKSNAHYCVLSSSIVMVRVRIRVSVWLVSGYADAFVQH